MALLWHHYGISIALLWHYDGITNALLCHDNGITMALLWHYYDITMALLWHYGGITLGLGPLWQYSVIKCLASFHPYYGITMALRCQYCFCFVLKEWHLVLSRRCLPLLQYANGITMALGITMVWLNDYYGFTLWLIRNSSLLTMALLRHYYGIDMAILFSDLYLGVIASLKPPLRAMSEASLSSLWNYNGIIVAFLWHSYAITSGSLWHYFALLWDY